MPGTPSRRCPGVLVDWRQEAGRWQGLVTFADGDGTAAVNAQIAWVPAEFLELAGGP